MKRLITKYSLICLTVSLAFVFTNCERITPAPPTNPDDYPTVTMSKSPQTNTVTEGDVIKYTFKADKPLQHATPFTLYKIDGPTPLKDAAKHDVKVGSVNYPSFVVDASITLPVTFAVDNIPEKHRR